MAFGDNIASGFMGGFTGAGGLENLRKSLAGMKFGQPDTASPNPGTPGGTGGEDSVPPTPPTQAATPSPAPTPPAAQPAAPPPASNNWLTNLQNSNGWQHIPPFLQNLFSGIFNPANRGASLPPQAAQQAALPNANQIMPSMPPQAQGNAPMQILPQAQSQIPQLPKWPTFI